MLMIGTLIFFYLTIGIAISAIYFEDYLRKKKWTLSKGIQYSSDKDLKELKDAGSDALCMPFGWLPILFYRLLKRIVSEFEFYNNLTSIDKKEKE